MRSGERGALAAAGVDFDRESGDLRGPAGEGRLAPQPAALLALLVDREGEVVTRDALKDHLWPGGRVEFDQGIAFALREVRKALEQVGVDPALIETLPRRGIRLRTPDGDAPVQEGGALEPEGSRAAPGGPARPGARFRSRRAVTVAGISLALVVVALWMRGGSGAELPVLVVFPYSSGDGSAAGPAGSRTALLDEALVASLTAALVGRAGVVGPAGVGGLGGPDDVDGARVSLGACLVLSGSVRQLTPDTFVVFTQIVRTSDRVHVWAGRDTLEAGVAPGTLAARIVEGARVAVGSCRD